MEARFGASPGRGGREGRVCAVDDGVADGPRVLGSRRWVWLAWFTQRVAIESRGPRRIWEGCCVWGSVSLAARGDFGPTRVDSQGSGSPPEGFEHGLAAGCRLFSSSLWSLPHGDSSLRSPYRVAWLDAGEAILSFDFSLPTSFIHVVLIAHVPGDAKSESC